MTEHVTDDGLGPRLAMPDDDDASRSRSSSSRLPVPRPRSGGESSSSAGRLPSSSHDDDDQPLDRQHISASTSRRKRRPRPSSAFILHDASPRAASEQQAAARRRVRSAHYNGYKDKGKEVDTSPVRAAAARDGSPPDRTRGNKGGNSIALPKNRGKPAAAAPAAALDDESAHIVNMALNLSESRRRASSRRNVSAAPSNPPRLAPIPDSASKSNLRQYFQQNRKASHTGSPRPLGNTSRTASGFGFRASSSMLSSSQDAADQAPFRYNFSQSTLARAQKAKDHLELMAEYRRLLTHLPPLKPGQGSTPGSSAGGGGGGGGAQERQLALGRPYDPLQYIRNRKVRTRERKVFDGEALGFADVATVRGWVDQVSQHNPAGRMADTPRSTFTMPSFPTSDDHDGTPDHPPKRARRPRVDWFFDPCDMVADAYWLEQDSHKQLIEDRDWRRIFPAPVVPAAAAATSEPLTRPTTKRGDDSSTNGTPLLGATAATRTPSSRDDIQELRLDHSDDETPGTRDRARLRLHGIKGFHHRHSSSMHSHHDVHHGAGRDSFSDASGTESDLRLEGGGGGKKHRPVRRDTITSDPSNLLEKQMLGMVAQEARDKELENVAETDAEHHAEQPRSPGEHERPQYHSAHASAAPTLASRIHSRKASVAEMSDSDPRLAGSRADPFYSHPASGRPSIDVVDERGAHHMPETALSAPVSPRLSGRDPLVPGLSSSHFALDSPSSTALQRSSVSPTRNPLSKVRRRFLTDKTYDSGMESQSDGEEEAAAIKKHDPSVLYEQPQQSGSDVPEQRRLSHVATDDTLATTTSAGAITTKPHRTSSNMGARPDPFPSISVRGLFKGPRIDTVIRGGVSKLGDLIWRKDEGHNTDTSADDSLDSDDESDEGGHRTTEGKQYAHEPFPQFQHAGERRLSASQSQGQHLSATPHTSRPPSRRPSKWEQLKPPRIDVRSASPDPLDVRQPEEAVEDVEGVEGADERPAGAAVLEPPTYRAASQSWSLAEGSKARPERTQLSRREVARMRALVLSSGIKAMEISRRAHERRHPASVLPPLPFTPGHPNTTNRDAGGSTSLDPAAGAAGYGTAPVPTCEMYGLGSRALGEAIESSARQWQSSVDLFTARTSPDLQRRIWAVRARVTDDLARAAHEAADRADEASSQLALDQPLAVKHVADIMEKLLRRRRQRFRWARRAVWQAVEWLLVGLMWFVWLVVTMLRVVLGTGRGVVRGARWLLWL